jgi:myo-inositol-1(or 4)-monophosphatase
MNTLDFATQLAKNTGKLLLEYYQPKGLDVNIKPDHTVVTEADLSADQFLRDSLSESYPNDGILSEEAGTTFPTDKSAVWIIDPLDGTTNFSLGLHYWGISISRLINGYPELGVLYFPLLNELFTSVKGEGAYLNGHKLVVNPPTPDQPTSFFSCCSRGNRYYTIEIRYKTRILGSAAYGLVTVARGSAILAFEVTPKVWDFAASWLITQEAGGIIAPYEGESPFPLLPGIDYESRSYPLLTGATTEILTEGKAKIKRK